MEGRISIDIVKLRNKNFFIFSFSVYDFFLVLVENVLIVFSLGSI